MNTNSKKKKKQKNQETNNFEIKGVIFIAIAILSFAAIYTDYAGFLSEISQRLSYLLLGIGAFFLPIYLLFLGYKYFAGRGKIILSKRFYGITIFSVVIILILGTIFIQSQIDPSSFSDNFNIIKNSALKNEIAINGGIIAYLITFLLYKLLGGIGSYVLYGALLIIAIIITFDISLVDLIVNAKNKIKQNKKQKIKDLPEETKEKEKFLQVIPKAEEEAKDEFLNKVNSKIKILDFMKNAAIDEEEDEEEVGQPRNISTDKEIDESVSTSKNENNNTNYNKKEKIDPSLKNEVTNEIESKLNKVINEEVVKEYHFPNTDLLKFNGKTKLNSVDKKGLIDSANKLEEILGSFGVDAKVVQVTKGPSVTRYELQPSPGVKVSKIVNLSDDIALGLAAPGVRIEAPIPGKAAVGIEVPNKIQTSVFLREVLDSKDFLTSKNKLAFALGKDIGGSCVVGDLSKMPHTLIAGATGSGKSVCINSLIISILYKYSPEEVKLLMVDPKVVELNAYNGIPHLLIPVVTDPKKAAAALNWAVNEMNKRYNSFAEKGVRNIDSYNSLLEKGEIEVKLPYIVIIVDELADLMMVCPNDVEDYIGRLAQMARAAGMHLVIATQRPSVDVITGVIKANIPSRISFAVSSQIDSRTILDSAGAEKLLGKGDMLYYPVGASKPLRVQGCFISEEEVENVIDFIKNDQEEAVYEESIIEHINNETQEGAYQENGEPDDELLSEAIKLVVDFEQASTSFIQRRLRIGFNRASRIMDQLEERGVITAKDGSRPRQVLMKKEELYDRDMQTEEI